MGSSQLAARIRVMNKSLIEKWVELAIDSVMEKPISHCCLVNIPWLWVGDIESIISPVSVGLIFQISV